jgi:thiol-disulfide isomerase/thioredoxin
VHQITALLLTLLFLTFTGCEDKKPEQDAIPVENTTVIVMQEKQASNIQEIENIPEIKEVESSTSVAVEAEETHPEPEKNVGDTFGLFDIKKETYTATVTKEGLIFQNNAKPIVLVQLFATWCAPCVGEIAYLNDLQETNQEDLFIVGVLTRDTIDTSALNTFTEAHHINYKILQNEVDDTLGTYIAQELNIQGTFPIPLIVIYVNGTYYTHYEGSVPVEMVKYDIKQAKQQLKNNEA